MDHEEGWANLGRLVREKRGNLTQRAFAGQAAMSPRTLRSIENAETSRYSASTVMRIEDLMQWKHGSVERVAHGLQPEYDDDPEFARLRDIWPSLSIDARRMLLNLAEGATTQD